MQVDVKVKIQYFVDLIVKVEIVDLEECKFFMGEDDDVSEKENEGKDDDKVVGK